MWILPIILIPDGLTLEEYEEEKELLCTMHIPESTLILNEEGSDVKASKNQEK